MPNITIINTSRRIYYFNDDLVLFEITDPHDLFFDVQVFEPVNEGQYRNFYIVTNNYRTPKQWNGTDLHVKELDGLFSIRVFRAATLEINNDHVILGNISKYGAGEEGGLGTIDEVGAIIDTVNIIIDAFGTSTEEGAKRFNKTVVWSDIGRHNYYIPEANNQAGDLDFDEDGWQIVRIRKLSEFNVVYKEKSIWLLIHVGLPFVYVKKFVNEDIGLLARNAIASINNVHYFVGHDFDIYRFDGVNFSNLSANQNVKDYIKARIEIDAAYQTYAFADVERKEIEFHFEGKDQIGLLYKRFAIVYNYETNMFFKRDSIARCGGYYSPKVRFDTIDQITDLIDADHDIIDNAGFLGIPARKLLIGDNNGFVHHYNDGDSFNDSDIDGIFTTGAEDFAEPSRGRFANSEKLLSNLKLLMENQGIVKGLLVSIGTRTSMDGKIKWSKPREYIMDARGNGHVRLRDNGVYHNIQIRSPFKDQYFRIVGFITTIDEHGKSFR